LIAKPSYWLCLAVIWRYDNPMRNRFSVFLCCAVLLAPMGCNKPAPGTQAGTDPAKKGRKPKVVFVTNLVDPFWNVASAGTRAAAKEFDVDCDVLMPPKGSIIEQKSLVETVEKGRRDRNPRAGHDVRVERDKYADRLRPQLELIVDSPSCYQIAPDYQLRRLEVVNSSGATVSGIKVQLVNLRPDPIGIVPKMPLILSPQHYRELSPDW
jgi:hypothetical protein